MPPTGLKILMDGRRWLPLTRPSLNQCFRSNVSDWAEPIRIVYIYPLVISSHFARPTIRFNISCCTNVCGSNPYDLTQVVDIPAQFPPALRGKPLIFQQPIMTQCTIASLARDYFGRSSVERGKPVLRLVHHLWRALLRKADDGRKPRGWDLILGDSGFDPEVTQAMRGRVILLSSLNSDYSLYLDANVNIGVVQIALSR
jgi:hypothetical protein